MNDLVLIEEKPVSKLIELRAKIGWGRIDEAVAARSIDAAIYSACLRHDGRLAGLARVMGDACSTSTAPR